MGPGRLRKSEAEIVWTMLPKEEGRRSRKER